MRIPLPVIGATSITIVAMSLAGCTPTGSSPSSPPEAGQTASPTANPLSAPPSLIPGACDDFLAIPTASAILGGTTTLGVSTPDAWSAASGRQSGDLYCSWSTGSSPSTRTHLSLEIRRHAAILAADPLGWWTVTGSVSAIAADNADVSCTDVPTAGGDCEVHATIDDYWVNLSLITPDGVPATARHDAMVSAAATVADRLRTQPVPAGRSAPPGAWAAPIDCAALGQVVDVSTAVGVPDLTVSDTTRFGEDFEMSDAVARLGGESRCSWSSSSSTPATVGLLSGAGWALTRVTAGSTEVTVPGADLAQLSCTSPENCSVEARLGTNLMLVSGSTFTDDHATTRQLVDIASTVVAGLRQIDD